MIMCYARNNMDISRYRDELEAIIPGVLDAYESLKTKNGMGIYTSNGAFYNHTFFGRDAAMAAKFVTDFDHQVTRETIIALAALQSTKNDPVTQQEIGRIHHEFRDFTTWKGGNVEHFLLTLIRRKWGATDKQLLTYYAADTTALYIRLVHKYIMHIDKSFLDIVVKNREGETFTVRESVARAANWLSGQVDERDHFVTKHPNSWALPFQTFQDSSTAYPRQNGRLANYRRGITYTEVQAFVIDALEDTTHLLENDSRRHEWQRVAHDMRRALLKDFWSESEQFFGSAVDKNGLVDMPNISAGWTLNTSLWDEVPEGQRVKVISAVVRRLFSDDFLTPVGLRTRCLHTEQPLPGVIEYHGRLTVWPMFTFMVIEGLRRHRLHRLATELETRLINGINASGSFEEFLVVDDGGRLLRSEPGHKTTLSFDAQMLPEKRIAFTVIPAMVLAWRATNRGRAWPAQAAWQKKLEDEIMSEIESTERLKPSDAESVFTEVIPTKFRRARGNVRSALYFLRERSRM
jgi:glycogen debranching enzyme